MYSLDSLTIIFGHHHNAILLAKMLIWAPSPQSMCTFSFCIKPLPAFMEGHFLEKTETLKSSTVYKVSKKRYVTFILHYITSYSIPSIFSTKKKFTK